MQTIIEPLISDLNDSRQRTFELIEGLNHDQLMGPQLAIVNPLLWEIGHVAYFYEFWLLRHRDKRRPVISHADELYDSIHIAHNDRWQLPLLSPGETRNYMQQVQQAVIERLQTGALSDEDIYLTRYALFHEDMHTEAFTYTRRTLNYPAPVFANAVIDNEAYHAGPLDGDVTIPGGNFMLGTKPHNGFCFDNEKWQHPVTLQAFSIARGATSYQQFAEFVDDGGYQQRPFWDEEGWAWLQHNHISGPNGWKKASNGKWLIKNFDHWEAMRPHAAVVHVNWYEASAWCRWANRRLPTEAEWERAASASADSDATSTWPWGDTPPATDTVNMDGRAMATIDVGALPASDSYFGCRQMLGNVWEWTADTFQPYPGFTPDMYADYSQPLFGKTRVLRGGAWPTRSRMIRNTWRNYYGADRNDVFAGFRSCRLTSA